MSMDIAEVEQMRANIVDLAQSMLAGRVSYIDGARAICRMLSGARLDNLQQPFVFFTAIESETDHVPVGDVKERWHPEAKKRLTAEWEAAERYAKSIGESACKDVIAWIDANPPGRR